MTDTLTRIEHPAVAALRDLTEIIDASRRVKLLNFQPDSTTDRALNAGKAALAASAAYDEAVGECVAALRAMHHHFGVLEDNSMLHPMAVSASKKARAALAKIAKAGGRS